LAELSSLSEQQIREWVDEGILTPTDPQADAWSFGADRIVTVRRACRLRHDFELEPQGLALAMQLLERIQSLEAEMCELQAKRPRFNR
jgi:hypothetical protein